MHRKHPGFTLIECLLALAILAALCLIAVPAFADSAAKARDVTIRSAMVETLQRTIAHAIATRSRGVLCPSRDGKSCLDAPDWSHGWIAFADLDGDRNRNSVHDTLLHAQPALNGDSRLYGTAGRTRIVVQPRGETAGSNATFTICNRLAPARATDMVLANSGRWRFATPSREAASRCAYGG